MSGEKLSSQSNGSVRIGFMGDFGLGPGHKALLDKQGSSFLHEGVRTLLDGVDFAVGNLECSILEYDAIDETPSNLFISPDVINCLEKNSKLHFCLANNHISDYGRAGTDFTMRALSEAGIPHFGAGVDYRNAIKPYLVVEKGITFGFICGTEFSYANAQRDRHGSAPMDVHRLLLQIRSLRQSCDFVVVILHLDEEFCDHPAPYRVRISRKLIDNGADAVIQHHPHVVQGIEIYKGKTIAYSLGNWAFEIGDYQAKFPQTHNGLFLVLEFSTNIDKIQQYTEYHVRIDELHRPVLLSGKSASDQAQRLHELSTQLRSPDILMDEWRTTCKRVLYQHLMSLYYLLRKNGFFAFSKRVAQITGEPLFWRQILGWLSLGKY